MYLKYRLFVYFCMGIYNYNCIYKYFFRVKIFVDYNFLKRKKYNKVMGEFNNFIVLLF